MVQTLDNPLKLKDIKQVTHKSDLARNTARTTPELKSGHCGTHANKRARQFS
jgi:hypothetical protein